MNYISLFSGVGGFEIALNRYGHKCVFASEIDKYAQKTYKKHFNHRLEGDITKIPSEEIPSAELLVAGFPDNWTEGVSDTQRYKQMGNAVTVNVVDAIVKEVFNGF